MLKFIKKHQTQLLWFTVLIGLYLATRLINLLNIPIFTDEAIYLRWSQIGTFDARWRYIPLIDGKPPLFHWFVMITLRLFNEPLFAGRIVSVISGLFNLVLIWLLSFNLLGSKKIANLSALFYLLSPFALVYDRLALVDSLLTTFSLISLLLAVSLVKKPRLDVALLLGGAIGAGLLTKASGLLYLLLTPLTLLLFDPVKKARFRRFFSWAGFILLAAVISQIIYAILRLSEFFYRIAQKNDEFLIPFSQFLAHPFALTWGNAKSLFVWQIGYLTIPIALLILISLFSPKFWRQKLLLLGYYLIPFFLIATFNKIIFARYLLFSAPFLLILAAIGLNSLITRIKSTPAQLGLVALVFLMPSFTIYTLLTNPLNANLPRSDQDQYLDNWSAGWGITDAVDYFRQQSIDQPIYIGTQGTFGLMPYALEIYFRGNDNIQIESFWPVDTVPEPVLEKAQEIPTFFVYNELEEIPPQPNIELVKEYPKGNPRWKMRIYKVKSLNEE